jgi:hypothetical protein
MMLMMKKTVLATACLVLLHVPLAHAFGSPWWTNETSATYVAWPQEVIGIVEEEKLTYQADDFPGLPLIRVFQAFPEFEPRVWPLVKGMTRRLFPLLWPRVHYFVEDGYEFGCRAYLDDDSTTEPVVSAHCERHCIHQGRYCAPQKFEIDIDGPQGHDELKEITRRLCLETIYHAKDQRVIDYLEAFDNDNCWAQDNIRNCSIAAMHNVGAHWVDIQECVQEKDWTNDVPHPILDRNLKHILEPHNFTLADMPVITINGEPVPDGVDGMLDSNIIFSTFCQAFPEHYERPFACDVCEGCGDTRTCMWTLACDGVPFDVTVYFDDGRLDPASPATSAPSKTKPPKTKTDAPVVQTTVVDASSEETWTSVNEAMDTANDNNDNDESSSGGGSGWVSFFTVLVIAACVCPLGWWAYKERRTQHLLAEIRAGKYNFGYKDRRSNTELGGRQKELDEEDVEPYVDVAVGGDERNDIVVEDMMDDDSEWSENKRGGGRPLPEVS